jgi:hypothetical protein
MSAVVSESRIGRASAEMVRARRDHLERTYSDRLHRRVSNAIDTACDQVELVNLAGGGDVPPAVRVVLAQLQRLAGERTSSPATSWEAHEELFRLSCVLLGRPEVDAEDEACFEPEAER